LRRRDSEPPRNIRCFGPVWRLVIIEGLLDSVGRFWIHKLFSALQPSSSSACERTVISRRGKRGFLASRLLPGYIFSTRRKLKLRLRIMFEPLSTTLGCNFSTSAALTPPSTSCGQLEASNDAATFVETGFGGIRQYLTATTCWRLLLLLLIATNLKHLPFVYHLRILNAVRFVLRSQRPAADIQPGQLFQPLITSMRSTLLDMDVYGHKVKRDSLNKGLYLTLRRATLPTLSTSTLHERIWSRRSSARA
jgi:hypothetical protein